MDHIVSTKINNNKVNVTIDNKVKVDSNYILYNNHIKDTQPLLTFNPKKITSLSLT